MLNFHLHCILKVKFSIAHCSVSKTFYLDSKYLKILQLVQVSFIEVLVNKKKGKLSTGVDKATILFHKNN